MNVEAWKWIIFGLVLAYNAGILLFMAYLKSHHHELWSSFAGQGIFGGRFVRTGIYALFQGDHWNLKDRTATGFVFAIRFMAIACVIFVLPVVALMRAPN